MDTERNPATTDRHLTGEDTGTPENDQISSDHLPPGRQSRNTHWGLSMPKDGVSWVVCIVALWSDLGKPSQDDRHQFGGVLVSFMST